MCFDILMLSDLIIVDCKKYILGAIYKGRPANGEGGGFGISDIPGRGEGGVVCESSDVRKFLKKYFHNCFLNISQSSITVSVVLF